MTSSVTEKTPSPSRVDNIKKRMAFGAAWLIGSRLIVRAIALVSTIILARILTPEDFGVISLAMTIIMFVDTMSTFGFDTALVANNNASDSHYHTAWSLSIIRGLFCVLVLVSIAAPFADFYDDQRIMNVIYALSVYTLLRSFENIGIVNFRKKLEFDREFVFNIYAKISGFIIVMIAVYITRDYRALIIGMLGQGVARLILSYKMSSFRPVWSLSQWRQIMNFSKWILVNNFLRFINERGVIFIVGKTHGVEATGLLSLADEVSNLATTELMWPIQRAVFPGYAKMSHDRFQMRVAYQEVLNIVVTIGFPLGLGLSACADQIVFLILGTQWSGVAPLVSLLAIAGALSLYTTNSGLIFLATNNVRYVTLIALIVLLVKVPFIALAAFFGSLSEVCIVYIWSAIAMALLNWHLVAKVLGISLKDIIKQVFRPTASAMIMLASINWLQAHFSYSQLISSNILQLLLLIIVGCAIYFISLFILWFMLRYPDGAEKLFVDIFCSRIRLLASGL